MNQFLPAILLLCALSLSGQARASAPDQDIETARVQLLQQIDTMQQAMQTLDAGVDPDRFDRLRRTIRMIDDVQLSLIVHAMSSGRVQEPGLEVIQFPEPDIPPACEAITPELGLDLFVVAAELRDILAAAKWLCLESVAGNNAAAACIAANIAKVLAEFAFEGSELCLAIQRSAVQKAVLKTEGNVAEHLNDFVDAKVSSRASQSSLDELQTDVTQELDDLNSLATSLATDISDLGADLTDTQNSISSLLSATIDMTTVSQNIRLKTLVTHAEVGEADDLAADAQQTLATIRNHAQQIAASVHKLQGSINGLNTAAGTRIERELEASLGRAMADPNFNIIRYKLPASMGGELERSREVLVRVMLAFDGIGEDTTMAARYLDMGDDQFNAGRYLSAYGDYSLAYRMLVQKTISSGKNE